MVVDLSVTEKQNSFIAAAADEVLFGGAAGGGKSYAQLIDCMLFALKYPKSKQLLLRRTFPELERSLIKVSLELFPKKLYSYNSTKHLGTFRNGSTVEFGYCDRENDVYKYQSAEYDVIRFDELTHFTEEMYVYLISRIRGVNSFPKMVKSSTNPGGVGHFWVKERFIDPVAPFEVNDTGNGTRVFIPAKVQENKFLMEADKGYIKRLENLSEKDRKALLYGDWNIFEGQYFSEFKREIHVVKPFCAPSHWKRYVAFDYGLDMLAAYLIVVDEQGKAYVTDEIYKPNLIISAAAAEIKGRWGGEGVSMFYAPPDLWNRRQDTGKSVAEIFYENGIVLIKSDNNRVSGWMNMKEWLHPYTDEMGETTAKLVIFEGCVNLIRCIPALTYDKNHASDVANEPHEITHAPDAIRYFVAGRPVRAEAVRIGEHDEDNISYDSQIESFLGF